MNDFSCDREQEVVSALRSGTLGPDLLRHTDRCPVCADVVAVTQFLQEEAQITLDSPLPDASFIWRKAELRSRREALAKATRPIRVLTNLGYLAAVVAGWWLVVNVAGLPTWLSELDNYRVPVMHLASEYLSATVLLGGIGTLLCAFVASSYLVLSDQSKRSLPGRLFP